MKFSIITCTYNSKKYVQKNIDSLKNQSFRDFEHIFIDGFSTDGTTDLIRRYQQEFPEKVRLYQFEPRGIANAMNEGIRKACGEYLLHLHSDDSIYARDTLEIVSHCSDETGNPDFIYGKAKFINDDGLFMIIPHRKIYQKLRYWLLLLTNYIPHQATFIKKSVFEKYGIFNEHYRNSMDYEMWLRLSKKKISNIFLDIIVCNFSVQKNSQSSTNKQGCLEENILILKKYVHNNTIQKIYITIMKKNFQRSLF